MARRCSRVASGKQVAGELPGEELVERQVVVERLDDPVAPRPDVRVAVGLVAEASRRSGRRRASPRPSARRSAARRAGDRRRSRRPAASRRRGRRRSPSTSAAGRSGRTSRGGASLPSTPRATASRPSRSSRARTKRSIGFAGQARFAISRRHRPTSAAAGRPSAACTRPPRRSSGGEGDFVVGEVQVRLRAAASARRGRSRDAANQLALVGLARDDHAGLSMATSRTSSRRSALRVPSSGPWQTKQRSERIGRMWKL